MKKFLITLTAIFALIGFTACSEEPESNSQKEGQALTEQAYKQQSEAVPYPVDDLKDSLERRNLRERLLRQNEADRVGYVYFFPFGSGEALGYWTIKGKVSSTQSQMTTQDLVVEADFGADWESQVIGAPGDDGSYGPNEKGVFFFTTEDVMVQVCEDCYFYSDAPVALNVPELNAEPVKE